MILDNLRTERGWQMNERQLREAMGVEGYWPDAGVPGKKLGNTIVFVGPKNPKGRKTHRAMAVCAICGKVVAAGRLHQHIKVHKS